MDVTTEYQRLQAHYQGQVPWLRWGPYLSERAWGTVREDYSSDGDAWRYFPHDHARSRVYRWNEDGLAGISDDKGRLCLALTLWNGRDPILKERMFGLAGPEGNHGEDVKEYYFYLDSSPTHSYMKLLYKYPQAAFPYAQLVQENARRTHADPEFELLDTGVFDEDRYFDIFVEYAKATPEDILVRISAVNRGPEAATLHLLPTLWFRNTWAWIRYKPQPQLRLLFANDIPGVKTVLVQHQLLGQYHLYYESVQDILFTNNETNFHRLSGSLNTTPYVKDAFHEYLVNGNLEAVNPAQVGTKTAAHYTRLIETGATAIIRLRLTKVKQGSRKQPLLARGDDVSNLQSPFTDFDALFVQRQQEADEFYAALQPPTLNDEEKAIQRQALAGLLWSKQFYHYVVEPWLKGDPTQPPPPPQRKWGRNREWRHLHNEQVMSVPDKWEYPWYAAWDLAFHCLPLALVDPNFAKNQLILLLREWYQHPNGQVPAYEWAFGDVNPPVLAWAAWRVYQIEQERYGRADRLFLERVFHKLMLYFTWWVNRKDTEGKNVFQGGFLGLDNIGVFDRSAPLPTGGYIEQSDGTSWMAMFTLNLMTIALELAQANSAYEDIALKFFEHFLHIAAAMNNLDGEGIPLWNEEDDFFYDVLRLPDHHHLAMRVRSFVGLIPLFAVDILEPHQLEKLPAFKQHTQWFLDHRPDLVRLVSRWRKTGREERRLLALARGERLKHLLRRALDPSEFLSDYGVRSLSRYHADQPYALHLDGVDYTVSYEPAESRSGLFGGNSNWRGPIWFPVNYLLIESLRTYYRYYGDGFKVECPTGSGRYLTLAQIADELSHRLIALFRRAPSSHSAGSGQADSGQTGQRPVFGEQEVFQRDPHWRDYVLFYEFFHGDTGTGLGASHQTGWTGLVAMLIQSQVSHQSETEQPQPETTTAPAKKIISRDEVLGGQFGQPSRLTSAQSETDQDKQDLLGSLQEKLTKKRGNSPGITKNEV